MKISHGKYTNIKGIELHLDAKRLFSLTDSVCWNGARVNHYVIKSWQEFKNKKQPRGRAMRQAQREDIFFTKHDLNDCSSNIMQPYIDKVEQEIKSIEINLSTKTNYYFDAC